MLALQTVIENGLAPLEVLIPLCFPTQEKKEMKIKWKSEEMGERKELRNYI